MCIRLFKHKGVKVKEGSVGQNFSDKVLSWVERVGDKLPDPASIFVVLTLLFMVLSWVLSALDISVTHPLDGKNIAIVNLLGFEALQNSLASIVKGFQGFPPLGLVLVVVLGAGVADKTGLMIALLKRSVAKAPKKLVTPSIILIAMAANAFGDAGPVVLPPLAAMIYASLGRHPLLGVFVGYGAVLAGFSANFFINITDILAASFTIPAAQVIMPEYNQTPAMNYYFLLASTFFLTAVGTWVAEKVVEPRLGTYVGKVEQEDDIDEALQIKGLKWAGYSLLFIVLALVLLSLGDNPFLGDRETGSLLSFKSYLMQGMIPIITIVFLVPAIFYGIAVKKIKNDKDVIRMMGEAMSEMGSYIVLIFFAAQFLAVFTQSNIGIIMAVKGAEFLKEVGISGIPLMIAFVLLSGTINIFVGSASAKWAILAPIFVPLFLLLGYDPALTQMAYRIGDSVTNPISPLLPYFPIVFAYARKYKKDIGVGQVIANMLPFSVAFFVFWVILLVVFMMFDLPLGPGAGIYIK